MSPPRPSRICAPLLAMMMSQIVSHGAVNRIQNGDFEAASADPASTALKHWETSGPVSLNHSSGKWVKMSLRFNSGDQDQVAVRFIVEQGSTGTLWFDNLSDPKGEIVNPGFEDSGASGPRGWQVDHWGKTATLDTSKVSEGEHSIRIEHANDTLTETRLWQDIPVERNREYHYTFDLFVGDDFQGEMRALVFTADGTACILENYGEPFASGLVATRDLSGRYAASLASTEQETAVLSQRARIPSGSNLLLKFDYKPLADAGDASVVVEDARTGRPIGSYPLKPKKGEWQGFRAPIQTEVDEVKIALKASSGMKLMADNFAIADPEVVPQLQQADWKPASENYRFSEKLKVRVEGPSGKALQGGLGLLEKDLAALKVRLDREGATGDLKIFIGPRYAVDGKGDEAYGLEVGRAGITIKAAKEAGAFYGLMTLLQLIETGETGSYAIAGRIVDFPDMPLRGMNFNAPRQFHDFEQAARWKMNTAMLSIGYPVGEAQRAELAQWVEQYEALNLRMIPMFNTLISGYYVGARNPNLIAGICVEGERHRLHGETAAELEHRYVVRSALSDIRVRSANGKTAYTEGKDYRVIEGRMAWPFDQPNNASPFAIARIPGSAIRDGQEVLINYDYVSTYRESIKRSSGPAYIPLEPETQTMMCDFVKDLSARHAFDYINFADDLGEFFLAAAQLETDSRVIRSGKHPAELHSEDVVRMDAAAKSSNPAVRTLQWAGHLDETSRVAGPLLPKDTLINVWGYDATWPATYGLEALEYWTGLGLQTSVMPWDNLRNIWGWAQVVAEFQKKSKSCIGMIGSCWEGRTGGFRETANAAWNIPKPGDKRYVPLTK